MNEQIRRPNAAGALIKGGDILFTDKELEANKEFIRRKKRDILNSKDGSDIDYG